MSLNGDPLVHPLVDSYHYMLSRCRMSPMLAEYHKFMVGWNDTIWLFQLVAAMVGDIRVFAFSSISDSIDGCIYASIDGFPACLIVFPVFQDMKDNGC